MNAYWIQCGDGKAFWETGNSRDEVLAKLVLTGRGEGITSVLETKPPFWTDFVKAAVHRIEKGTA